jgi:hypothetical protein
LERENEMAEVSIDDRINDVLEAAKTDEFFVGIYISIHTSGKPDWHIVVNGTDDDIKYQGSVSGEDPWLCYQEAARRVRFDRGDVT